MVKRAPFVKALAVIAGALLIGLLSLGAAAEGEPIVKAIVVRGNEHIDTALIQSAITQTKLDNPAIEDQILADLRSIYDLGYFYDVKANFESAPGGVKVVFDVDENPIVQEIVFKGATRAPVHEFKSQMQVQPGEVLNVNHVMEDLRALPDWVLTEYGIALRPTDLKAGDDGIIEIEIAETILKDIKIEGNEKTRDYVILREMRIQPGEILDMNRVNQSLRRILMLGFFDEVSRSFEDGETPDETIMTIHVTERKTGSATFGGGYSTNDGFIAFVDVAEENFMGRGQRVNAYLEIGKGKQTYQLGFYEPYIDDQGTSFGANLYKRDSSVTHYLSEEEQEQFSQETEDGKRHIVGGDVTLGRPLTENTRARLTLKAQNITYTDELLKYESFEDYRTRSIGLGLTTNTVDHPFFPTEGFRNDIRLEIGTGLFGGDSRYSKVEMEHSRFFEVRDGGYVLALRGMGGRRLTGELMDNELFRIGGQDSLRGYQRGDEDLVGDKMFVLNAEFRFPIVDKVQGVVFTDWGRAWEEDVNVDLTELKNSYGLGVRLDTPIGLMRLDYGFGYDEEEQKREGQFYFGIGQTF